MALALPAIALLIGCHAGLGHVPAGLVDLDGKPADLFRAPGTKVAVLIFVRSDCPISNKYAPEIRRIRDAYAQRGVAFHLVYADPDESAAAIRAHGRDYDLGIEAMRDPRHAMVRATGVTVTPEAVLFLPRASGPEQVYRGRIDDRFVDLGKERSTPTTHDLEEALDAVLGGRSVRTPTTEAVGCLIADLR